MDQGLALHFSDATYIGVHRLFVDAYCLQHPDEYCASFKSLAAHLAHLCWSVEHGGSVAIPSARRRIAPPCSDGPRPPGTRTRHCIRSFANGSDWLLRMLGS